MLDFQSSSHLQQSPGHHGRHTSPFPTESTNNKVNIGTQDRKNGNFLKHDYYGVFITLHFRR